MPEIIFESIEVLPEELRGDAKKNDAGKFVLNLVQKTKLDEFRENNIKVAKERDELVAKFGKYSSIVGEDTEKFSTELEELRKTRQQVADGKLKATDDVEKVLADRTAAMRGDFEGKNKQSAQEIAVLKEALAKKDADLRKVHIDRRVTEAVFNGKTGALPEALPHIMAEAYKTFVVTEDGEVIPKQGEATIYGSDGTSPMTPTEWLAKLREKSSYLFERSTGGGASGGKDTKIGGMSKADFDKLPAGKRLALANMAKK